VSQSTGGTVAFSLNRDQRQRLLKGDYGPLYSETKPAGCEPGATYVLSWARPRKTHFEGAIVRPERYPTRYLTVSSVKRHRKGGWLIRFEVTDLRAPVKFLRASPPVFNPHEPANPSRDLTASEESFYTTSRWAAIDELEVVPREWMQRNSKKAYERDRVIRLQRVDEQRVERNRRRRRRRAA
jgi:hypothetical protein